jgi:FkbM family methyltransferase
METGSPPYGACEPRGLAALIIAAARTTLLGRGQTRKLLWRALARRAQRDGERAYDMPVRGARMRLYPFDNTVERKLLLRPEQYCAVEIGFLANILSDGGTFIDIGANIGAFTLPIAALPGVRVVAVEPNPSALERLTYNVAANGLADVAIEACALSDRDGEVALTVASDDIKLSGIEAKYAHGPKVTVPTRTLAGLLAAHAPAKPLVVKIDVEGHEDAILLPYFETAAPDAWPQAVVIETIDREDTPESLERLAELGYRTVFKTRANIGLVRSGVSGRAAG